MITIMGASGKTGHEAAQSLLRLGARVRAIARTEDHLRDLAARGAEIAIGDATDARFLASAFKGSDAVYTLLPPNMTHPDYSAYQDEVGEATVQAIKDAGVPHVVLLSSYGADLPAGTGPIAGLHRQEKRLGLVAGLNVLALRAAYFFENHFMSLPLIKQQGINGSAIKGDLPIAQVATHDIGAVAAQALRDRDFERITVREVLGPRDLSMAEATTILGAAVGKPDLQYVQFPYDAALDGMMHAGLSKSLATLYVEMSKGFNDGLIKPVEGRSSRNTTPTRFEDFATQALAPAYRAQ